jgi:hypothetical protein
MRRREDRVICLIDGAVACRIVRPRLPLQDRRRRVRVGQDRRRQLIDEVVREGVDLRRRPGALLPPGLDVADDFDSVAALGFL